MRLYFVPYEDDIEENPYFLDAKDFACLPILDDESILADYYAARCKAHQIEREAYDRLKSALRPAGPLTDEERAAMSAYERSFEDEGNLP